MRQVPALDAPPIGIAGAGRVARHFHYYLTLLGLRVCTWSRGAPTPDPPDAFAACRTILLLIQDSGIVPLIQAWPTLGEKRLVHFSGSLVTPLAEGAHPLMTFGHDLYDLATYRSIPFIVNSEGTPFRDLLPGLPNPSFTIPAADRPYYHALCVMAGNFSTILWLKLFDEFQSRFNIPASAAYPYLARIAANLVTDASHALTGPLSRGDAETIGANLSALEGDPFNPVYRAFVRAYAQRS